MGMIAQDFVNRMVDDNNKKVEGSAETLRAYLDFRGTFAASLHHALMLNNPYAKALLPEYLAAVIGGEIESGI